jgi:hypothetical protein
MKFKEVLQEAELTTTKVANWLIKKYGFKKDKELKGLFPRSTTIVMRSDDKKPLEKIKDELVQIFDLSFNKKESDIMKKRYKEYEVYDKKATAVYLLKGPYDFQKYELIVELPRKGVYSDLEI